MTTLRVLLHVAAQRDYELHSLDISTAFLQDMFFATADTKALALVKSELQKRQTCTDLGELRSYIGLQINRFRARRIITLTLSHMVHQVLQRFGFYFSSPQPTPLSTGHSLSAPPSDESTEPSGMYPELVGYLITSGMGLVLGGRGPAVLISHADASLVDDSATQRSSQGYTFSLAYFAFLDWVVHVPKEKRDKLQAAAVWAVHLGLARGSKGWLMWDPKSNTIFTPRDAKFMEGLMFKEWSERGRSKVTIPLGIEVGTNNPLLIPIDLSSSSELTEVSHDLGGAEEEASDVEEVLQQGEAPIAERGDTEEEVQQPTPSPKLPPRRTTQGKRDAVRGGAKEGAAKERPKRAAHPRDFLKYERLGVPKALLVEEEEYEEEKGAEGEMEQMCCFGVNLPHEPASMEEALAGDDREAWLASREDDFQSHMENETWTLTNLPPRRKALDCTWVLRVKTDAEGRLERRKTRLVIKGFQQREGIDFQEVFAPVAKAPMLRLLLAAAAVCGWKVEQMDVKTAFLYGVVDEEIYMKQPEGYDDGSGRVCRLNKAIYGLKQAPRCWYARLVEVLEALGFKVSGCDESLFMTEGEKEKVFLLVYVDESLLFSPSLERIKEVQGKLKETFQCKALGPVGYYLGLHVVQNEVKGWLRLHQHKYLAAMGEKYGLEEGRSVKTPLPSGFQLHLDEEEGEVLEYELQRRF
ncbi:unnamed protein product [Closterium sp. NIES-53]